MFTQDASRMKSPTDEPPSPGNPEPQRRRKKKRSNDVEKPEPRRDKPSPEIPHDPQDVPEQELRSGI